MHPDSSPSAHARAELVDWLRGVDADAARHALALLYRAFVAELATFAYGYVRSRDAAEDVVQDAFLQVWRRRQQLPPDVNLRAYLYRAVRNLGLNAVRHAHRTHGVAVRSTLDEHAPGMGEGNAAPDTVLERETLDDALQRAIDALPERTRDAFLLVRHQRLSYAEAAETLGVSPKTIENQLVTALKRLRAALTDVLRP